MQRQIRGAGARAIVEAVEPRQLMSHTAHFTTRFADGSFAPGNWSLIVEQVDTGGSETVSRIKKGGHPGAYRLINDTVNAAGSGQYAIVFGFNEYKKGTYNPAAKGAITSIKYSEYNKLFSGFGDGQSTGAALMQNGKIYYELSLITPTTVWTHQTQVNLTAANFTAVDGTHPDFSQAATLMKFGFFRSNASTARGAAGFTSSSGIDNFSVTIKSSKT